MTIELSDEATERLRAEAAARGTTAETLVAERAQVAPAPAHGCDEDERELAESRANLHRQLAAAKAGDTVDGFDGLRRIFAKHGWTPPERAGRS